MRLFQTKPRSQPRSQQAGRGLTKLISADLPHPIIYKH